MDLWSDVVDQYRKFALHAVDSPTFAGWSEAVADDPAVLAWLDTLPRIKRQPNLVYAAARMHGVAAPGPYAGLRDALLGDDERGGPIRATIMSHATQTNEVGRLATLVPALALIAAQHGDAPLSLVEVGASAGLCLYPDRYSYRWSRAEGALVTAGTGPELRCRVSGPAPLPRTVPAVAARRGIDLNPLDVTAADDAAWLELLIWPEGEARRALLGQAIAVARQDPPDILTGDLLTAMSGVIERAAADGPVVVFHTAVIAYLDAAQRARFDSTIRALVAAGASHWISNEAAGVLPSVSSTGAEPPPGPPNFVLGIDGQAVAWTHGHGHALRWLAPARTV